MSNYSDYRQLYSHESALFSEKKDGIVYTPDWLAQEMLYHLLDVRLFSTCSSHEYRVLFANCFKQVAGDIPSAFFNWLLEAIRPLKILDLSCGSGVLLLTYLDFYKRVIGLSDYHCDEKILLEEVIDHCIYGVDINPQAIGILNETLTLFCESNTLEVKKFNLWIANSLIAPILECSYFDLIIGNPPYIGEKYHTDIFAEVKATEFGSKYYEGKMDYFYFFIYKGYELLKPDGVLTYVTSNYFLTADGAIGLRQFINESFFLHRYVDYEEARIFPEKKLHGCTYCLTKWPIEMIEYYKIGLEKVKAFNSEAIFKSNGSIRFVLSDEANHRLKKLEQLKIDDLGVLYSVNQGIVSGADKAYVIDQEAVSHLPATLQAKTVKFYKNSDIGHFKVSGQTHRRLIYFTDELDDEATQYFEPFRDILIKRREVKKGIRKWYQLTWPRNKSMFELPKIVAPQRASSNRFAYVEGAFYASADVYYISERDHSPYSLKVLALLLNSSVYKEWLLQLGKRKGNLLELYATPLKALPIIKLSATDVQSLELLATDLDFSNIDVNDTILKIDHILNHYL
ncbi:MAG: hypothetical protein BGO41_13025 [Clostridiales bacterium 38-18]|nr:MAG: hypothetical protein BGO41_13025 [Clostridiales bacterium 38-18]